MGAVNGGSEHFMYSRSMNLYNVSKHRLGSLGRVAHIYESLEIASHTQVPLLIGRTAQSSALG